MIRFSSAPRKPSGFTLIELLVVIAIIAILAAILFPVFGRARENARRSSCASNMKQIGLSIMQYTQDFDDRFPVSNDTAPPNNVGGWGWGGWVKRVAPYIKSVAVFSCPSDSKANDVVPDSTWAGIRMSYAANGYGAYTDYVNPGKYELTLLGPIGIITPGFYPNDNTGAMPQSQVTLPSTSILVGEKWSTDNTGKTGDGGDGGFGAYNFPDFHLGGMFLDFCDSWGGWGNTRIPSPGYGGGTKYDRNMNGAVSAHHLDMANFLFIDGHVKAMRPIATNPNGVADAAGDWWRTGNMWNARRPG